MNKVIPTKNTPDRDVVFTPSRLAKSIISHFKPEGVVLDPARGGGSFYDNFPRAHRREWCEISRGRNFFDRTKRADWIITNPPWSIFKEFLSHSMDLSENVVLLATVSHFVLLSRLNMIKERGFGIREFLLMKSPREWGSPSGFQVAAGHVRRGRFSNVKFTWLEEDESC